ncbi:hypothetical protein FIBSPDRAFT_1050848 [Athelia psychrophila]|uniref:HNH nuclease domain-containing protein n=1 Tax=Athelia psychrophila TaxID=1759441 RepID=A0A166A308_9AGAM|nr:hypothetical protein FIBSPDRAFT_1050848 [Fibularhizoctonia sp. CBS 109695]
MESDHPSSQSAFTTSPSSSPEYDRDATYKRKVEDFGNRSVSSQSSFRLEGLHPNICILTGDSIESGKGIEKAHIIPLATEGAELRKCEWLLGYKAGELHINSHHNITILERGWHGTFDNGKWALVPDKEARDTLLKKLTVIVEKRGDVVPETSEGVNLEEKGRESAWPHFEEVFYRKDKRYQYRFLNVALRSSLAAIWENDEYKPVDLSLQPLESHVHPLHVIIDAYRKINDLKDASESSLEVIKDIREIWDIWHSIPVAPEFLQYGRTDSNQSSGMGPPPEPSEIRRSTLSSSGHDERSNDGDN